MFLVKHVCWWKFFLWKSVYLVTIKNSKNMFYCWNYFFLMVYGKNMFFVGKIMYFRWKMVLVEYMFFCENMVFGETQLLIKTWFLFVKTWLFDLLPLWSFVLLYLFIPLDSLYSLTFCGLDILYSLNFCTYWFCELFDILYSLTFCTLWPFYCLTFWQTEMFPSNSKVPVIKKKIKYY